MQRFTEQLMPLFQGELITKVVDVFIKLNRAVPVNPTLYPESTVNIRFHVGPQANVQLLHLPLAPQDGFHLLSKPMLDALTPGLEVIKEEVVQSRVTTTTRKSCRAKMRFIMPSLGRSRLIVNRDNMVHSRRHITAIGTNVHIAEYKPRQANLLMVQVFHTLQRLNEWRRSACLYTSSSNKTASVVSYETNVRMLYMVVLVVLSTVGPECYISLRII